MPNALHKFRMEVKRLRKKHPSMSQQEAQQKVSRSFKSSRKVSGKKRAKGAGKKKVGTTYRPVTVEHCQPVGKISGSALNQGVKQTRDMLQSQLGWLLAAQKTARTQKEKKGMQPEINKLTRQVKALK